MKKWARIFTGAALLVTGIYLIIFAVNGEQGVGLVGGLLVGIAYTIGYEGG